MMSDRLRKLKKLLLPRSRPRFAAPRTGGGFSCIFAWNEFGGYCVPRPSLHRPAAQAILAGDVWEPETIRYMCSRAGAGDIIHAGTYFGDFLPALSEACDEAAKVWAFEPVKENYRAARITVELNELGNIVLINACLGDMTGQAMVRTRDTSGRGLGGASQIISGETAPDQASDSVESVEQLELDDVVPEDRQVSILQLDVEGFERQALDGAMQLIKRCRPVIILETLPSSEWLQAKLEPLGYRPVARLHSNTVFESCH